MINNIDNIINFINNKRVKMRKATLNDFQINNNNNNDKESLNNYRVKKNQGEYGQKKFIKP